MTECSDYSETTPVENQPRDNQADGNEAGPRRSSRNRRPPDPYGHEHPSNPMGNLHYRLNFDPGKTNKIFHHSSKKQVEISRTAKFGCKML